MNGEYRPELLLAQITPCSFEIIIASTWDVIEPIAVMTFTWARLFLSCKSPPVGITPKLKCVFKATCHHSCLPCSLAPCSGEGDICDSSPREPSRRTYCSYSFSSAFKIHRILHQLSVPRSVFSFVFTGRAFAHNFRRKVSSFPFLRGFRAATRSILKQR